MPIHAEDLRRYLAEATGRPINLRLNSNLHSLITSGRDGTGPGLRISLHRMFLEADAEVLSHLAVFVYRPTPEARRVIRTFINQHRHLIVQSASAAPPRRIRGTDRGHRFCLAQRAAALNARYFDGRLRFRIIWGKAPAPRHGQRNVTLGTWNDRQQIIRIHPMLDLPGVPSYFIDYVIYHEMTHIAVPSTANGAGRLVHHSEEFYRVERRYDQYEAAQVWEARWLHHLIAAWNGGRPLPKEAAGEPDTAGA